MKIYELRKNAGKSQSEIAKYLGISQSNYSKYELEVVMPSIATLIKLADFYGVTLDYLCGRSATNKLKFYNEDKRKLYEIIEKLNDKQLQNLTGYETAIYQQK